VVVVGPWHLPVTPAAASPRAGLLDTLWGRAGAGSLPHAAGAASVILSVRLSVNLASVNLVEGAFVMVDAASALATSASAMDSRTASAVAGGVDIRGGTQAITIPLGGGILHPMTRTTIDS